MRTLFVCLVLFTAALALLPPPPGHEPVSVWNNVTVSLRKIKPSYLRYLIPRPSEHEAQPYYLGAIPPTDSEAHPTFAPRDSDEHEHDHEHHHHHHHKKIDVYSFCTTLNEMPMNLGTYQAYLSVTFDQEVPTQTTSFSTTPTTRKFGAFIGHYHSGKIETSDLVNELTLADGGYGVRGFNVYQDLNELSGLIIVKHGTPAPTVKIAIHSDLGFSPVATILIYPPPKTHCDLWNERIDAIPAMQRSKCFSRVMFWFLVFTTILAMLLIIRRVHMKRRQARRNASAASRSTTTSSPAGQQRPQTVPFSQSTQPAAPQPLMVYSLGPNGMYPTVGQQQMVAVPLQMVQSLYPSLVPATPAPAPVPAPVAVQTPPPVVVPVTIAPPPAVQYSMHPSPPAYSQASNFILKPLPQSGVSLPLNVKPPTAPTN